MSHRILVKDSVGEREMLLVDKIVVGRDPNCDITEPDPQLSRRHAELSVCDRGVVVRDLNSRNGMLVNGRRVLEAVLHPGDVVQVASLAVTFLRASVEPKAVSMPSGPAAAAAPPAGARRPAAGQPDLPFRPWSPEDERTGQMSSGEVRVAAASSVSGKRIGPADREASREAAEVASTASTVAGNPPPPWRPLAGEEPPPAPDEPTLRVSEPGPPAGAEPKGEGQRAAPEPKRGPEPAAPAVTLPPAPVPRPPLVEPAEVPIREVAEVGWAGGLTWQVATLALLAFFVGAASMLPATGVGTLATGVTGAVVVLLAPLAGVVVAVTLGLYVAARLRRSINQVLERARRP